MQFLVDIVLFLIYVGLFLLLCAWAWKFWVMYVQTDYLSDLNETFILLEIKLPREIDKSPLATELAIASLLQTSGLSGWFSKYYKGKQAIFGSLEIASIEGVVHFYVRVEKRFKTLVESAFYSQYPGIEIMEADDYTKRIRYHHLSKDVRMWGVTIGLIEKWKPINEKTGEPYKHKGEDLTMPADFFPIKTYVDFGLDKDPKEEYKVDPLSQLLESMSRLGKGEHFWYQILIEDEGVYNGKKAEKMYLNEATHEHWSLKDMVDKYRKQLRTGGWIKPGDKVYDEYGEEKKRTIKNKDGTETEVPVTYKFEKPKAVVKKELDLTADEKDQLEVIGKKLSKPLARVVIRILYVAEAQRYQMEHMNTVMSFQKGFKGANGFVFREISDPYDYPWQGIRRIPWRNEEIFEGFVEREGLHPHLPERETLEYWEDNLFWLSSMKTRKTFRMFYEAIFHPFDHPKHKLVSVLNLEEIASLWHLPGSIAGTSMLPRIDSTKVSAPPNLPH